MFFPHKNQLRPGAQDVLKTLQEECSLLAASSELVGWFQGDLRWFTHEKSGLNHEHGDLIIENGGS